MTLSPWQRQIWKWNRERETGKETDRQGRHRARQPRAQAKTLGLVSRVRPEFASRATPEDAFPSAVNTLHDCAVPDGLDIGKEGERQKDTDQETDGGRKKKKGRKQRVFDEEQDRNEKRQRA